MEAVQAPVPVDLSPARSRALFVGALAAALFGLTLLDVPVKAPKAHAGDARSIDCIVAAAVFAGVTVTTP
jgi:hypothetical protein